MRRFVLPLLYVILGTLSVRTAAAQDITNLGGELSNDLPGRHAIQVVAPNVTDEARRLEQLNGFGDFHQIFTKENGLGPEFINASCGGCHKNNGRGPARISGRTRGRSTMVVKASLPGLQSSGAPIDVPGVGEQLLNHTVVGRAKSRIVLSWSYRTERYPDGSSVVLRKPRLRVNIRGMNARRVRLSLRMTPAVIGPGLLESIADETLLELSDPDDLDGDGISGRPNYVPHVRAGGLAIGRFGFRSSHPTVEQQTAAAFIHDIGIDNPLFVGASGESEISEAALRRLVIYQKLAGVPRATDQDDPRVVKGKGLFQTVNCHSCHRMTVTTGSGEDAELSNQEIHPFTDLLLHDMGPGLADRRAEYDATGSEWKTTPLWGLGFSRRLAGASAVFLHDGRARSIEEAILWHNGEAKSSRLAFMRLSSVDRRALLAFLESL